MPTNIDELFEQWDPLSGTRFDNQDLKNFARFFLEKHIADEINFLDHLLPNVNDPAIESRIESLKTELKP